MSCSRLFAALIVVLSLGRSARAADTWIEVRSDHFIVIADVGDPAILFETPQKSPDRNLWTLKPLGGAAKKGLEGSSVQLTFLTPDGPYAVTREIAPSQP